ncbi:type II toxin-antitoxin system mRNA interferase toxin, RelE/StbE family [Limosilactobacillus caecicola]|uniref:type II toxin-antitoxin system mRNA interferase toxin, RelE/StbE family n=1 Tax=Limosilactobacillus caecicola TaxID=2941332 RepID=UPI00203BEF61|nr:type II toxin-antitoxin system mRNA interferase toxin, RelE/StbE family [Limosilactobacillus caecicola]
MKYQVNIPDKFWLSIKNLRTQYTRDELSEIVAELKESIRMLANNGKLPDEYHDHLLRRSPYVNYNEYHIYDDDVLVIYQRREKKLYLRFVEVTNHQQLRKNSDH